VSAKVARAEEVAVRTRNGEQEPKVVSVSVDTTNEQVVIAAALVDPEARLQLARKLQPDHFLLEEHRVTWAVVQEMVRRKLDYDPATFQTLAAGRVETSYIASLTSIRPELPANLDFHVEGLLWDRLRAGAATGPVAAFLEALKNPREMPERVRSLARQISQAFDGSGERRFVHDAGALVRDQVNEVKMRMSGHACWPFGIDGFDYFEDGRRRLLPGAAPGKITLITGVPGGGKSTFAGHIALGLARQRRKVCFGAWEMGGGMTLELLACLSLGWSRAKLLEGKLEAEELVQLEERMHAISQWVVFMANPFRRTTGQRGRRDDRNERNLDTVQAALADTGAEVFIADLWKRCLVDASPEAEEEALYRQQAMAEELGQHHILLQQLRSKDVEQRADKRPTREGIKGSSAYFEVADAVFGVHRPGQWKSIVDDKLQVFILKQRFGRYPLGVELDWEGETGQVAGGYSIEYEQPGEGLLDGELGFKAPPGGGKRRG
jgi:replicative DNA helicase